MILGFAHITRNVRSGHPLSVIPTPPIPSAPEKWPLMVRQATSHRIEVPTPQIELVEYDTDVVEQPGRLGYSANRVVVWALDVDSEMAFFRHGVGFVSYGDGSFELGSAVRQWCVRADVLGESDAPIDPPLDIAGYAALAFYSSDVEADSAHLLKHGGRTPTEPFTVTTSREWKVIMLRSPEGTIIELLQAARPHEDR